MYMNDRYVASLIFLGFLVMILVLAYFIDHLQKKAIRRDHEVLREATERHLQIQRDAANLLRLHLFWDQLLKLNPPEGVSLKSAIERPKYRPVFAGVVDNSDRGDIPIVVYKHRDTGQYYLEYDRSDDVYPLSKGTAVTVWEDTARDCDVHLKIENSSTWNGTATGTWRDLQLAEAR
jgi:hypothetical protein